MFFYIKCVLFVLVLSISGEISAQEKRDSVRIYFLHRQIICLSITYQTSKSNISQISNFQLHFLIKLFLI